MDERVVPKMTNFCVVKLSNSPAITCVPRLELNGPALRILNHNPIHPELIRDSLIKTKVFLDFPVGYRLMVAFPFVVLVGQV